MEKRCTGCEAISVASVVIQAGEMAPSACDVLSILDTDFTSGNLSSCLSPEWVQSSTSSIALVGLSRVIVADSKGQTTH